MQKVALPAVVALVLIGAVWFLFPMSGSPEPELAIAPEPVLAPTPRPPPEAAAEVLGPWAPCPAKESCKKAVRKLYPDPQLREAMDLYCEGTAANGLVILRKIAGRRSHPERERAAKLVPTMQLVETRWKEGAALILNRKPEAAEEVWREMLVSDCALAPEGSRSFYRQEAMAELVRAYRDKGQAELTRGRPGEALTWALRGLRIDEGNPTIKGLVLRLEQQGAEALRRASTCEEVAAVLSYTRAAPASPTHREALAEQQRRGCR